MRAEGGYVDFVFEFDGVPALAVEVKLAILRPVSGVWADSPDFLQLRRYMSALDVPGLLVDAQRLLLVRRGADNQAGDPIHPGSWGHWFNHHVKEAGLRRIRLHDMRHTAATLLLQVGVAPVVVAGILGHSPAVLMSTYAHALPDAKREAVVLLADIYRAGA